MQKVIEGPDAGTHPAWRLCQWATRSSLAGATPVRLAVAPSPLEFSGIYPHLAYFNQEDECGTGAVVPWAGKLWVVTYGPHLPQGSSDKLYEIAEDLSVVIRPESIGGTPANRMIHRESHQLFIGPYVIDAKRNVRVIPYTTMFGRHTANMRHLNDPAGMIYYATMEEGLYEVDVKTLAVKELYRDANKDQGGHGGPLLPGYHGKGAYSGQGRVVYANNGEFSPEAMTRPNIPSGCLAEWDGREWQVIRRNQFCDVTGPGGIYGNADPARTRSGPSVGIIVRCCCWCWTAERGTSSDCRRQRTHTTAPRMEYRVAADSRHRRARLADDDARDVLAVPTIILAGKLGRHPPAIDLPESDRRFLPLE